ncbi:phospholipase/Carboxylesterase superfamily protein [Gaeumannomyces tritici R3-111a-1]|uniref:Phospholipase/Carboxylesterase superfamily protein n=1 Tax=Gaeumannomyces tritici (strain R3-111a-1) TaxID=644352 RepID=J3P360_GAET3|nr:phospholipase/Carboxylesterase superfamily protein [Gaeumannomyces tritici R3-111a-1]EJT74102.1 phospholipase/Carboxylesterase superfamily protein [Gaeumannomyces tritici R3-111a-1]
MAATSRPPTRVPTREDFAPLTRDGRLAVQLHFPSPPESTTAILVLLHGLGDSEAPFAGFARAVDLPGVLAIAVRGVSPLPPAMLGLPDDDPEAQQQQQPTRHFHWGDDLRLDGDRLDPDPGFDAAEDALLRRLVVGVLGDRCGWDAEDVLLFGFGQGGSVALGLASRLRASGGGGGGGGGGGDGSNRRNARFKGVVSIGGPLPRSMVPTVSDRAKAATPALLCRARRSEGLDDDAVEAVKGEFETVEVAEWKDKTEDGMPASREEMMPIMRFFADRLGDGGGLGT